MKLKVEISNVYDVGCACDRRTLTIKKIKVWWPFPVAFMTHSSSAMVFGHTVYGTKKRWPKKVHRVVAKISNARYWVKYRLRPTKYHWVDTGLKPGYYDPDTVLLHAAMACLGRYIEEMGGLDKIEKFNQELTDPNRHDKNAASFHDMETGKLECDQADRQDEAASIWRWWTEQLPADEARTNELLHKLYGKGRATLEPTDNGFSEIKFKPFEGEEVALYKEFRALEEKILQDKQQMLHRLIDIRESLWT